MPQPILLNNGLVTSRDPSLLREGELTRADDSYYEPNDPAIRKVKGRTAFNSSALSSAVIGARYLEFDSATDLIAAHYSTVYATCTAATTGTFASLVTGLTAGGSTFDSVHYNNFHYLMNGVDTNREIASDGTALRHGMAANTAAPTVSRDAGSGTGMTITSASTITYWVEERVKSGSTITKRNATTSSTQTVTLTGDGTVDKPVITRPTAVNSEATHWALYGTATNGAFPTGAEIAEVVIGTTTIEDTRTGTDPDLPTGDTYELSSVSLSGTVDNVARNGPPPIASTGDVFEDSLVMDDSTDRSLIRYSWPDTPHAFPSHNVIRFETKEADEVFFIRTVGRAVVVGMRDSLWRIDTLPRPEDAAFQTGRVKEQIHGAQGGVGPMSACLFSFGQGIRLAYASRYGILVTDGFSWDVLTDDIDWDATVDIPSLSSSVLINNPALYRLEFYYTPAGGTANTKALYLHYHPSQAKQGEAGGASARAKVTGPINVKATSAFVANLSGQHIVFTGNTDGKLYQEWSGNSDDSGAGGIAMVVRTGDIYHRGVSQETTLRRLWVHHQAHAGQTATVRVIGRNEQESDNAQTVTIKLDKREATSVAIQDLAEAYQYGVENSDSSGSVAFDFIQIDNDDAGYQTQKGSE